MSAVDLSQIVSFLVGALSFGAFCLAMALEF